MSLVSIRNKLVNRSVDHLFKIQLILFQGKGLLVYFLKVKIWAYIFERMGYIKEYLSVHYFKNWMVFAGEIHCGISQLRIIFNPIGQHSSKLQMHSTYKESPCNLSFWPRSKHRKNIAITGKWQSIQWCQYTS